MNGYTCWIQQGTSRGSVVYYYQTVDASGAHGPYMGPYATYADAAAACQAATGTTPVPGPGVTSGGMPPPLPPPTPPIMNIKSYGGQGGPTRTHPGFGYTHPGSGK